MPLADDEDGSDDDMMNIPNKLNYTQAHMNLILGHSLAKMYQDTLKSPVPERLQSLLDQLKARQASDDEHRN